MFSYRSLFVFNQLISYLDKYLEVLVLNQRNLCQAVLLIVFGFLGKYLFIEH